MRAVSRRERTQGIDSEGDERELRRVGDSRSSQ